MDHFCEVCDRLIIENEPEYYNYLTLLRKKDDKVYIRNVLLIIIIWMKLIKH